MKLLHDVTIGSDPEVFIKHSITNKFIPAYLVIPDNSKNNPLEIKPGYSILHDNATLEGSLPPAKTKYEFLDNMKELINVMETYVNKKNDKLVLQYQDSAKFNLDMLNHDAAKIFGCEPYKNVYLGTEIKAEDMSSFEFRVSGCHIHIGYTSHYKQEVVNPIIVKAFDLFLTIPFKHHTSDEIRDKYYGGFGQYRDKKYGLECRSLGGFAFNPKYHSKIYDNLMKMIEFINSYDSMIDIIEDFKFVDEFNIKKYPNRIYKRLNINYSDLLI